MKKQYNELSDIEKTWIREYNLWCKSARNDPSLLEYAITQAEQYREFLASHGLNVSDYS